MNSSLRAVLAVLLAVIAVYGCSAFFPVANEALNILCRVQHSVDGGLILSINRVYLDGSVEQIDATVVTQD